MNNEIDKVQKILYLTTKMDLSRKIISTLVTDDLERSHLLKEHFGVDFSLELCAFICEMIDERFHFFEDNKNEFKLYKLLEKDACVGCYIVHKADSDQCKYSYNGNDRFISVDVANIAINLKMLDCFSYSKLEPRFMELHNTLYSFAFNHPEFDTIAEIYYT